MNLPVVGIGAAIALCMLLIPISKRKKENKDGKYGLLGYYDYTVIATYAGMLFALIDIYLVMNDKFTMAAIMLMLAGGCDMVDGAIASTKKRTRSEKNFGIQIDSLCDLVSFCILPAIFAYRLLGESKFGAVTGAVYALAGLIRLAYFNVLEGERQLQTEEKREEYLGIPVTSISVLLPLLQILILLGAIKDYTIFAMFLYLEAAGFLSPMKIRKPAKVGKIVFALIGVAELAALLLI